MNRLPWSSFAGGWARKERRRWAATCEELGLGVRDFGPHVSGHLEMPREHGDAYVVGEVEATSGEKRFSRPPPRRGGTVGGAGGERRREVATDRGKRGRRAVRTGGFPHRFFVAHGAG